MAVNDIYRVTVGTYWGLQVGLNVTHWRVAIITGNQPGDALIAGAFDNKFANPYKGLLHSGATYYGVRIQRIQPGVPGLPAVSANFSGGGLAGAAGLPPGTSGVITFRTPLAGRSWRGRIYVPFPSEADNGDVTGRPVAGYVTNLAALGLLYRTPTTQTVGGDSVTLEMGVFSRKVPAFTVVTQHVARDRWATQRRRSDFGRVNAVPPF